MKDAARLFLLALVAHTVHGQDDACVGRTVTLGNGNNFTLPSSCGDKNDCSKETCVSGVCSRAAEGCDVKPCRKDCTSECGSKQCGNDAGCPGMYCGTCSADNACNADQMCTSEKVDGSCNSPLKIFSDDVVVVGVTKITGDSSAAAHILTPLCNFRSASVELIYKFVVPAGKQYGFEIRTEGDGQDYDTVLSVMKGQCATEATIACSDDATPPGNYGSLVSGVAGEGTYYVQVDGYDSTQFGKFAMSLKFAADSCVPKCDGAFCGSDGCGGSCGECNADEMCNTKTGRCWPKDCKSKCDGRKCGEDGCGTELCGKCADNQGCQGSSISTDLLTDEEKLQNRTYPKSICVDLKKCDYENPTCSPACGADQYCASDCTCYSKDFELPDLIVAANDTRDDMYLHQVVPATS